MRKYLLPLLVLISLVLGVSLLGQGPLTPLMNLRGRTDASGYLITSFGGYTGPDGPLTSLANLRGRTDANGYLLTTQGSSLSVPSIVKIGRALAQVATNASVVTFTVGATDGSFEVSANVLVTTATTHNFDARWTYTDEGNTSRTIETLFNTPPLNATPTIVNTNGAVPYAGMTLHLRAKAATTITLSTVGTFTTVVYNIEGIIKQTSAT